MTDHQPAIYAAERLVLTLKRHQYGNATDADLEDAWAVLLRERWRPIEEAPRDGTKILVVYDGDVYVSRFAAVWHPLNKMWVLDTPFSNPPTVSALGPEFDQNGEPTMFGRTGPTHFQPLPPAPGKGGV